MNNGISSINPSFQANIVTKIQDRNGVMEKVSKRFAEKTKNYSGDLNIIPLQSQHGQKVLKFSLNENSTLISPNLNELLGTELNGPSEVSNELIDKITDRYVNILRALKLDTAFYKTMKNFFDILSGLSVSKRLNRENFYNSTRSGNFVYAEMYKQLMIECDQKAQVISEKIGDTAQRYYNILNNLRETEPVIQDWCDATQMMLISNNHF